MDEIKHNNLWKQARALLKAQQSGELTMQDWLSTPNAVIKRYFMINNQQDKRKGVSVTI